jgi:hypothetical protein
MIGEDRKEKLNLLEGSLDRLTFYINPEIYHNEKEYLRTGKIPGQTLNMEFKQHSETAQKYGKPIVSPLMKSALSEIYDKDRKRGPVLMLMGKEGIATGVIDPAESRAPVQIKPEPEPEDDEDCLG